MLMLITFFTWKIKGCSTYNDQYIKDQTYLHLQLQLPAPLWSSLTVHFHLHSSAPVSLSVRSTKRDQTDIVFQDKFYKTSLVSVIILQFVKNSNKYKCNKHSLFTFKQKNQYPKCVFSYTCTFRTPLSSAVPDEGEKVSDHCERQRPFLAKKKMFTLLQLFKNCSTNDLALIFTECTIY